MENSKNKNEPGGGLALLDQALHSLREEGSGLGAYYLGTGPFCAAALYYWVDMSQGSDAWRSHEAGAFGLVLLFFWMSAWQARFAANLRRRMAGLSPLPFTWKRWWRRCRNQGIFQGMALLLLPAAAVLTLPFPWMYAYFHNIAALDDGEENLFALSTQARAESLRWPGLNTRALLALSLAGPVLFINIFSFGISIPFLLKTLFGIETIFSRTPWAYFNSTTFVLCSVATYLLLDPLIRAFYALRCHYGQSLSTGADLQARLAEASAEVNA